MAPRREAPAWLGGSRVLIVVGKGGVGTSTVAAATAVLAAQHGLDVLLVAVDGKPGLGPLLGGGPLTITPQTLGEPTAAGGRIRGCTITPKQAFNDYLELKGFGSVLRKAASAASFDVIAGSTPGMEHLLVLGKIKELDRERAADLIIVDVPPAGHATPFLRSAAGLQRAVDSGPVREQADEVAALLTDPTRTQCLLVTLAEETPVNEVVELAGDLTELGLAMAAVVVNACWPDRPGLAMSVTAAAKAQGVTLPAATRRALDAAVDVGRRRLAVQREQLAQLDARLPLPRLQMPRLPVARLLPEHLSTLAAALDTAPHLPQPTDSASPRKSRSRAAKQAT
jgi:arsenite/tail-anchored protein-transporting ATPase